MFQNPRVNLTWLFSGVFFLDFSYQTFIQLMAY